MSQQLDEPEHIRATHDLIWQQLGKQPYSWLQQMERNSNDQTLSGWYQLAALIRESQGDYLGQLQLYNDWRQLWQNHPAAVNPPSFFLATEADHTTPNQIALLLPLQDEYEVPGNTLLNGFMSAYYKVLARGGQVPAINIYDTSALPLQQVYNQAVSAGAEIVIGPMRQSEVEELLAYPSLPVPTITLNRIDRDRQRTPENFFQFGLSPIDEIAQITERAWQKGYRNIIAISPSNSWGKQAAEFVNQRWTQMGGQVLATVEYAASTNDFTPLLQSPLHIGHSQQRSLQLERLLGKDLSFTPRRRQDIDLVVLLAYPNKARQIKPALDFLYASSIPVYASSHIYSGSEDISLNRDLSGIEFSAMPWMLPGSMPEPLSPDESLHTAYRQLYALGFDAFILHSGLGNLRSGAKLPVYGSTGLLSLSGDTVRRHQKWAKFKRGQVVEAPFVVTPDQ